MGEIVLPPGYVLAGWHVGYFEKAPAKFYADVCWPGCTASICVDYNLLWCAYREEQQIAFSVPPVGWVRELNGIRWGVS